jgi:hypothetical protein
MRKYVLTFAAILIFPWSSVADEVSLTIYNNNLGLVKQTKALDFDKGISFVRFDDVAALIDPTSVHIKPALSGIEILEQNYQYDLISTQKMMQRYLGEEIGLMIKDGDLHRGTLMSFDGKYIILKSSSGEVTVTNAEQVVDYRFGAMPEGLILKPTLVWLAESEKRQKSDCEVSYLTDGLNWHAEYVAVVDKDDKNLDLSGWVSIDNKSGATYKEATLKLVAGDVHRVTPRPMAMARGGAEYMLDAKATAQFEEEAFFEYHLYSLQRPATVADNETKQISLFPETGTSAEKVYIFESGYTGWRQPEGKTKIKVNLEFVNSEERGLGMPLPQGKLRVYKADSKGQLQFIGEDLIDHIPKDEKVRVFLGEAFDITGERKKTDVVDLGSWHKRETYEITLKNHKDEDIAVTVVEATPGWYEWHITRSNIEYKKVSAYRVEFQVPVKSDGESVLTYTIEY